jgi:hypothetical protein
MESTLMAIFHGNPYNFRTTLPLKGLVTKSTLTVVFHGNPYNLRTTLLRRLYVLKVLGEVLWLYLVELNSGEYLSYISPRFYTIWKALL